MKRLILTERMKTSILSGDLVRAYEIDVSSRVTMMTSKVGAVAWDNPITGEMGMNDIALVISQDDVEVETLVLTSTGVLGWIVSDVLKRVSK